MRDGHLNKCKECTKKDVKLIYKIHSSDESWMDKERKRGRDKFRRLGYRNRFKKTSSLCLGYGNISKKLRVLGYNTKNKEAHHWNYNKPLSVLLLSRRAHKRLHLHLKVNDEDKYCYTEHGERLDTEEKAIKYFRAVLEGYGIHEDLKVINIK